MSARVVFFGGEKEIETINVTKNRPYVEDFCSIGRTVALNLGKVGVALS